MPKRTHSESGFGLDERGRVADLQRLDKPRGGFENAGMATSFDAAAAAKALEQSGMGSRQAQACAAQLSLIPRIREEAARQRGSSASAASMSAPFDTLAAFLALEEAGMDGPVARACVKQLRLVARSG